MNFAQGFIYWGITVVSVAALALVFWKFFLCTRTAYENRKNEMGWGVATMVLIVATLLFIPIMMTQADSIMVELASGLQKKVQKDTDSAFRANSNDLLEDAADELIVLSETPKIKRELPEITKNELSAKLDEFKNSEAKKKAVADAHKFAGNKTFREQIETFVKLYALNASPLSVSQDNINETAFKFVEPIGKKVRKNEIQIPSLGLLFRKVLSSTSLAPVSGVELPNASEEMAKAIHSILSKTFVILSSVLALALLIMIFVIIVFIKEPKNESEDLDDRSYLFEFDRLDKTTGKKISEKLNQYN